MKGKPTSKSSLKYWIRGIGVIVLGYIISYLFKHNRKNLEQEHLDLYSILPPSGSILKSIAIPRVSGSKGIAQVRSFIKSQFPSSAWEIEEDTHVIDSSHGPSTTFTNLIFTLKSSEDADRVILAAHYDSKLLEAEGLAEEVAIESLESKFIGATDSAWSCALMIAIGKSIQKSPKSSLKLNFQLIFFDGEEAVKHWSPSDSLYGSKALASKWSKLPDSNFNSLKRINLMVLLDLLGSKDSNKIYSFHPDNTVLDDNFKELIHLETKLFPEDAKLFQDSKQFKEFKGQAVEDDHTPFLPFGVPVLHLIPIPFSTTWHTFSDTIDNLDGKVCYKLSLIIYEFIKQKLKSIK